MGAPRCSYVATAAEFVDWGGTPAAWESELETLGVHGDTWECPHEALPDARRCPFHADPGTVAAAEVDVADRMRGAVERSTDGGENRRRHRQFVGATVESSDVQVPDVRVKEGPPISFAGATFPGSVDARSRDGKAAISSTGATIHAPRATFETGIDLCGSEIGGDIDLRGATVGGAGLEMYRSTVEGSLNLRNADLEYYVFGADATIESDVVFRNASFSNGFSFEDARIAGNVDLRGARVEFDATFDGATIGGTVDFDGATVSEDVSFTGADLRERPRFGSATICGEVRPGQNR